jgi:hypothetical protein
MKGSKFVQNLSTCIQCYLSFQQPNHFFKPLPNQLNTQSRFKPLPNQLNRINRPCPLSSSTVSNPMSGVCYTAGECGAAGGTASGSCASGERALSYKVHLCLFNVHTHIPQRTYLIFGFYLHKTSLHKNYFVYNNHTKKIYFFCLFKRLFALV